MAIHNNLESGSFRSDSIKLFMGSMQRSNAQCFSLAALMRISKAEEISSLVFD
jgi:hypothetical protein